MRFSELPTDQIVAMPLDRLSQLVLVDLVNEWNWRNWLLGVIQARQLQSSSYEVKALGEAIQWLSNRGLISPHATQTHGFDSVQISRLGQRVIDEGLPLVTAIERLNINLVPVLEEKARPQFLLGDYEIAAFAAMKEVEISVRERANDLDAKWIGVDLMRQAFKPGGPLADDQAPIAEQEAQMALYAGAIGLFKNPASHKRVDYNDPTEASEIVLLADLLLRMLAVSDEPTGT